MEEANPFLLEDTDAWEDDGADDGSSQARSRASANAAARARTRSVREILAEDDDDADTAPSLLAALAGPEMIRLPRTRKLLNAAKAEAAGLKRQQQKESVDEYVVSKRKTLLANMSIDTKKEMIGKLAADAAAREAQLAKDEAALEVSARRGPRPRGRRRGRWKLTTHTTTPTPIGRHAPVRHVPQGRRAADA